MDESNVNGAILMANAHAPCHVTGW